MVAQAARELRAALPSLERDGVPLADIALTLSLRESRDARLAICADSFAQLAERLEQSAAALMPRSMPRPPPPTRRPARRARSPPAAPSRKVRSRPSSASSPCSSPARALSG